MLTTSIDPPPADRSHACIDSRSNTLSSSAVSFAFHSLAACATSLVRAQYAVAPYATTKYPCLPLAAILHACPGVSLLVTASSSGTILTVPIVENTNVPVSGSPSRASATLFAVDAIGTTVCLRASHALNARPFPRSFARRVASPKPHRRRAKPRKDDDDDVRPSARPSSISSSPFVVVLARRRPCDDRASVAPIPTNVKAVAMGEEC
jgi:hypothetical protein